MNSHSDKPVIIGAGPAGMACAYTLSKYGQPSLVIERDEDAGGFCKTIDFYGYLFDIGGHRFLSKSKVINQIWHELMGDNLLQVNRISRIYYKKKFFKYPLSFFDAFKNLGFFESFLCVASYLYARLRQPGNNETFEGWITNHFGKRLYEIFFDTYTRKVWDIPCNDISADWAVQRIKGLSLRVALKKAFFGKKTKGPKTLAEQFLYPKRGPGEFFKSMEKISEKDGAKFLFNKKVTQINHNGRNIQSLEVTNYQGSKKEEIPVKYVFSSMPLPTLIKSLNPRPPKNILQAADNLHFRSFIVVNIIVNKEHLFPDQWIYIHSPDVKLGRIQNYKNWSPFMTVDPKKTSLGLEYFCNEKDDLWKMNDIDFIDFAVGEIEKIGLMSRKDLINGFVVRRTDAYPIYSLDYQKWLQIIREYLNQFLNLQKIGRSGLFRYGNSDHAMLTGIGAARSFLNKQSIDVWHIDMGKEYFEM